MLVVKACENKQVTWLKTQTQDSMLEQLYFIF